VVSKAQAIASDPASLSPVPGCNAKSRFVVSFRNPGSSLKVQAGKSPEQHTCDNKKYPAYASYKICSHVLAVAMQNKKCEELLKTCHSSKGVSLHDVAMIGMPKKQAKQVDVFPYLKTRRLCVLLQHKYTILNYHWYNSTVKINRLISNYDITTKSRG